MNDIWKESSFILVPAFLTARYWQQMVTTVRMFARVIWIHAKERDGELGKEDLLAKLYFPLIMAV
jgi:hypothetical protein